MMTRVLRLGLLCWLALLAAGPRVLAQAGAAPTLTMMETVVGRLEARSPEARWQFEASAGDVISLVARPLTDGIDPVLQVLDGTGRSIAGADDIAYPDRLAAAIEALEIPRDDTYTVLVSLFDADATGEFALSLLPAYAAPILVDAFDGSRAWGTGNGSLAEASLVDGRLLLEIDVSNALGWAVPEDAPQVPLDAYVQVNAAVTNAPDYWEYGLILRQASPTSYYLFSVSSRGDWAFLVRSGSATWVHLQDWTEDPLLADLEGAARLGVAMTGDLFTFYVNGRVLGTVIADAIMTPGQVALSIGTIDRQETFPKVVFDDLLITEPLPASDATVAAESLESWQAADSAPIMTELVAVGLVPEGGSQVMLIPSSFTTVSRAGINVLPLGQGRTQADFILSTAITLDSEGADNACGVFFRREENSDRYGLAFLDGLGGAGITYRQGDDFAESFYSEPGFEALSRVRLLLVGQGDYVRLYVNGALQAIHPHPAVTGGLGIAALSYDDRYVNCQFDDTWVWAWN
jgi:hypothetical protein